MAAPTAKENPMATKTHIVTCRLDDRDYGSLHENAAALDVAPSTYMRYLIRIPVSACPDPKGSRVLVVDAKTLGALRYELVRWGRHYNQGVHALNAIAYAARRKAPERDYFVQQIGIATDKLDAVEEGRRRLEGRLDELEGSIVVGDGPCRY